MRLRYVSLMGATALGGLTLSDAVIAQNITLEEIVVTAQRREQDLQSVPVPVSAFSVEQLENRQISEGQDLERFVPSLKMTNNITQPTNLSPSMRGSLQQDASLAVAESPFGIYVDDVYVGRLNGNNTRLADVERIEVLRGPQGTLYGRNTLAGALKFISKTPGDESWLDASVGYGNYDHYEAAVSAGGPVGDGLAGSVALQFNGRDGYGTNVATGENIGEEENWAGRIKLRYMGGENFDAIAHVSYADSRNDSNVMVTATTPTPGNAQYTTKSLVPTFGGFYDNNVPDQDYSGGGLLNITNQPRGDTEQLIASWTMSYDFDNATLKSITAYVGTDDYFTTDFSGFGGIVGAIETDSDQWTQELQLTGTAVDDRLNYILGAFYLNERANQDINWYFFAPTSRSNYDTGTDSYSVFGQADYAITDQLTVTAGLRWTRDEKDWDFNIDYFFAPVPSENIVDAITENSWTPKFGLDYELGGSGAVDSMLLYTSAAKGFKAGGFNGINIFDTSVAQSNYGAETNWTYEAGIKTEMFGSRFRLNANYFHNRISDLTLNAQVLVNGNLTFPVQNAGSATIQGVEMEANAALFDGFNAFATVTLLDGKFRNLDPTSAPANSLTAFGVEAQTPQTADYAFAIGFDYTYDFSLGGNDAAFKLGADMYYTDDFITSATNEVLSSAYDRINAYAELEFNQQWAARFSIANLEDDELFATGSRGLGGFVARPPQTYKFTLKYAM